MEICVLGRARHEKGIVSIEDRLREAELKVEQLQAELREKASMLDKPHFVQDYSALVRKLIEDHPIDEAMSIAVGGDYDNAGRALVGVLRRCGLNDGMSVIDLGCGSGRVAKYIGIMHSNMRYLGLDVVQELLDYASSQSPEHFKFRINYERSLPAESSSVDLIFAFSVFTHLLHEESFMYLEEAKRVLKPGGKVVFSFLETASNWPIFGAMVNNLKGSRHTPHLNMFMERIQIEAWASHLSMSLCGFEFGDPHTGFGQTVAMLQKH